MKSIDKLEDPAFRLNGDTLNLIYANQPARRYFNIYGGHGSKVACELTGEPHSFLYGLCHFERARDVLAHRKSQDGQNSFSTMITVNYISEGGSRYYIPAIMHAEMTEQGHVDYRILPLPRSFNLTIRDLGGTAQGYGEPAHIPEALMVRLDSGELKLEKIIHTAELGDGLESITGARDSIISILKFLEYGVPKRDLITKGDYDPTMFNTHINGLFNPKNLSQTSERLRSYMQNPLDALVLTNIVLPELHEIITNDIGLKHLPISQNQDFERLAFLRARLTLKELKEQDEYLGWLELPPDYDVHDCPNQRSLSERIFAD